MVQDKTTLQQAAEATLERVARMRASFGHIPPIDQNSTCDRCGGAGFWRVQHFYPVLDEHGEPVLDAWTGEPQRDVVRTITRYCECPEGQRLVQRMIGTLTENCGMEGEQFGYTLDWLREHGDETHRNALQAADRLLQVGAVRLRMTQKVYHGLYLFGPRDAGKSGLGAAMVNALIQRGQAAMFLKVTRFMEEMRRAIRDESDDGDRLFDRACTVPFLVMADLGAERRTEFAMERVYDLIDVRVENRRCTVITSNHSPAQTADLLEDRWPYQGERIMSRVRDLCLGIQLNVINARTAGEVVMWADGQQCAEAEREE
ncbi:MAG: ATP-binding protein [Anaerolineae bacterium]|nr:ATP-binding protein [Anaerolineae bacterium]